MKLVDMKVPKKDKKDAKESPEMDKNDYPWGLRVDLDKDSVKRLGLDISKMKVGGKMSLSAEVEVSGIHSDVTVRGEENERVDLQITSMALDKKKKDTMKDEMDEIEESRKVK